MIINQEELIEIAKETPFLEVKDGKIYFTREVWDTPDLSHGELVDVTYMLNEFAELLAKRNAENDNPVACYTKAYGVQMLKHGFLQNIPDNTLLYLHPTLPAEQDAELIRLLKEARQSLFDGLETDMDMEAEWSIADKELINRIDAAIAKRKDGV
jgi:hypothetical protein